MKPLERVPFAPLQSATGLSVLHMAEHLGMDRTQLYAWRRQGIPERQADAVAVRFGLVPYEIWPEWLERVQERRRASWRKYAARKRATPEGAAQNRANSRRYYLECGDYARARQRAYYQANREREVARARRRRERVL